MDIIQLMNAASVIEQKYDCKPEAAIIAAAMDNLTQAVQHLLKATGSDPMQADTTTVEPAEPAEPPKTPPAIDLDDLRIAFQQAAKAGKKEDLRQILDGFGVKKLPDLKPDQYPAVAEQVKGLAA